MQANPQGSGSTSCVEVGDGGAVENMHKEVVLEIIGFV
jgi:hypothetical protein